ncbi:MAG: HAD-IIIA family hydrolase [Elusimicrobiota bacterium]
MLKKIDIILYYGLFVLAFVLPISIAATNIVWIFLFLVWLIKIIQKKSEDFSSPVTYSILLFFSITIISAVFGINFFRSIKGLNSEMEFFLFFLILSNVKDFAHAKKIILVFVISSAIMGFLGLLQYLTDKNLPTREIFSMMDGRAHGTRSWPQTYAEGLLMALPVSIYAILYYRKKIFYLITVLIFLGIVFSYVRMVWIATVFIGCIIFFVEFGHLKRVIYILVAALYIALISGFFISGRRNIIKRATNFNEPVRINMWKVGIKIFKDYPVLGVGLKNTRKIYPEYYEKLKLPKEFYMLSHLHSNFIHLLAERGVLGLIAFLWLVAVFFYYSIKKARNVSNDEKFFILGCIFGIFGFFLSGLSEYSYGDSEVQMTMWFLMALTFYRSRAVFLDRDGTINEDMHYSTDEAKLKIFEESAPAIKLLNNAGFKVIIVSNQSGVARKYFTKKDVEKLNNIIVKNLKEKNAVINSIYVCPHHPDDKCFCRKPKPGMVLRAKNEFNISLKNSYIVGDMQSDIDLAKNVGVKSVFVLTGDIKEVKGADYVAKDILDAAKRILRNAD